MGNKNCYLTGIKKVEGCYGTWWWLCRTECTAIVDIPRCRVRYIFGQKWKTGTGRQYFTDIIYLQPLWYHRPENLSKSVKKTQN